MRAGEDSNVRWTESTEGFHPAGQMHSVLLGSVHCCCLPILGQGADPASAHAAAAALYRRKGGDPRLLGFFWTAAGFVMVTAQGLEVHSVHPSLQGLRLESTLPLQARRAAEPLLLALPLPCV